MHTVWLVRGNKIDRFDNVRTSLVLFGFFSSFDGILLVSADSVVEFSLINDADLKAMTIFERFIDVEPRSYLCSVHESVSDVFLKFFNGNRPSSPVE